MQKIESIEEQPEEEKDHITEAKIEEEMDDILFHSSDSLIKRSQSMKEPPASEGFPASLLDADMPMQHRPSNAAFYDERPDTTIFSEISKEQEARVRLQSPFGSLRTWRLLRVIVKSNDDVRQEQFAMQLISQIDQIFKLAKLPLWLKPYEILATGQRCGLIEVVSDALSIDSIKRKLGAQTRLIDYFTSQFGQDKRVLRKAQDNFC